MTEKFHMTQLTDAELASIKAVAERDGLSLEATASKLAAEELAARIKSKTGHAPAKVYTFKGMK